MLTFVSLSPATATPEVRSDIVGELRLSRPLTLVTGFDRKNLMLTVVQATGNRHKLEEIAQTKMADLNAADLDAAVRIIEGSCRSMGLTVKE